MRTKIWAHRGSNNTEIENSLAAFKLAIDEGADGIELDVQRSADGQIVVFHDENLSRLTLVEENLADLNWSELKELNIAASQRPEMIVHMPLLADVLELIKRSDREILLNIEIKNSVNPYPGIEDEILALVKDMNLMDQVLFSSFNHQSMHYLAQKGYGQQSALLMSRIPGNIISYARDCGVYAIHPRFYLLQLPSILSVLRNSDLDINVWTVDKSYLIKAALALSLNAIITNDPAKALRLQNDFETNKI